MKSLPINFKPIVRSFANHAFVDMICNNSYTNSNVLAEFSVLNEIVNNWTVYTNKVTYEINDSKIRAFSNPNLEQNCFGFYRKLKINDELVLQINKHLYTNAWSKINIFISKENQLPYLNGFYRDNLCIMFSRAVGHGYFIHKDNNIISEIKTRVLKFPYYLKVKLDENKIIFSYKDGEFWREVGVIEYTYNEMDYLGIDLNISDNQYLNWLYTNFINLQGDLNDYVCLDWINTPKKNYRFYSVNPILSFDYDELTASDKNDLFAKICCYLDSGKYVEIYLNEKYLPCTSSYGQKDYIHENLCYGYDEKEQKIYLINILDGKPNPIQVSKNDFKIGFETNCGNVFVHTLRYNPDESYYKFDVEYMVFSLKNYLASANISVNFCFCSSVEHKTYGVALYDMLMTDIGVSKITDDVRISYLLYEHKKIMMERLQFLYDRGLIKDKTYNNLYYEYQKNYKRSESLLLLVMKNAIKPVDNIDVRIRNLLNNIKLKEVYIIKELINDIEENIDT